MDANKLKVGDKLYGYNRYKEIYEVTIVEGDGCTFIGDNEARVGIDFQGLGSDCICLADTFEEARHEAKKLHEAYLDSEI